MISPHSIISLTLATALVVANLAIADAPQNSPTVSPSAVEASMAQPKASPVELDNVQTGELSADIQKMARDKIASKSQENVSEISPEISAKNEEIRSIKRGELSELLKRKYVNIFANGFHQLMLRGRVEELRKISTKEFFFEGRKVETDEDYAREMNRISSSPHFSGLKVSRYQVFSAEEMERNFGPRPERLAAWPVTEDTYFSVAEIGDSALVILWVPAGDYFAAVAIHD